MMNGSTLLVVAMIVTMIAMCGGMIAGAGFALTRRGRMRTDRLSPRRRLSQRPS